MLPDIVLQTDFGLTTGFVASMYGVIRMVDQSLDVFDLNHEIRLFDMRQGSFLLRDTIPYWKGGTVFVSVVDPGVGTARRASVAHTCNGYYVVTPDNGSLTYIKQEFGIDAIREIDETVNRLKGTEKTSIFHGRDLFAYCAAKLAAGVIDFAGVGPEYPVDDIITFEIKQATVAEDEAHGSIPDIMEPFGNLETNIRIDDFEKTGIVHNDNVRVVIKHEDEVKFDKVMPFNKSFGYAAPGCEILYNSSSGFMGLAMNQKNFAQTYGIGSGPSWSIDITKEN